MLGTQGFGGEHNKTLTPELWAETKKLGTGTGLEL
jgi:hypothetical protein